MTGRQKFGLAVILIASVLLIGGWISTDHWLPVVQSVVSGA